MVITGLQEKTKSGATQEQAKKRNRRAEVQTRTKKNDRRAKKKNSSRS